MKTVVLRSALYIFSVILIVSSQTTVAQPNIWTQKAFFGGSIVFGSVGFGIGDKGYVGTGFDSFSFQRDFWEYDPTTGAWAQLADLPGLPRYKAVGFSIGSKGYIGTGTAGGPFFNDFWEYDPATNGWIQKANVPGGGRYGAVGFSIGDKGYIGTGFNGVPTKDFWEYDPTIDNWVQKADVGGPGRYHAIGFAIGSKGYVGTGESFFGVGNVDFWEYDQGTDSWIQKGDFPGGASWSINSGNVGFSLDGRGYMGLVNGNGFWSYEPGGDTWTQKADFGGVDRSGALGFSAGSKGYVGTGFTPGGTYLFDFWEYTPDPPPLPLWGMTTSGGINGEGTIFSIGTDGSSYQKRFDFSSLTSGRAPTGSLLKASDGNFYGFTNSGGTNDYGTFFKISETGLFTKIIDLASINRVSGSLIEASDGNFYGLSSDANTGLGSLFRITPAGAVTVLHTFNGTNGGVPLGSLTEGTSGLLYGVTAYYGNFNGGTIFSCTTSGVFNKLWDFNPPVDGQNAFGNLTKGPDGNLYGVTTSGGANDYGTIFRISPAGVFTNLRNLDFNDGIYPAGSLTVGDDGDLYGMTSQGGIVFGGTIFKISTAGTFNKLRDMDGMNTGSNPQGSLVQGLDGTLFGLCYSGGTFNVGTIFSISPDGSVFQKLRDFQNSPDGANPQMNVGLVFTNSLSSGPPTITNFTPAAGYVGRSVTITGTNFSSTPANNVVAFNGVTATITLSSPGSITATVPPGATTGPISVTADGNTVTTTLDFFVGPAPTVIMSDSLALVAFYTSAEGTNWINKTNWLTGPVNTWFGVTVSGNRVSQINLPANNLGDLASFPPEFGSLTGLTVLRVQQNILYSGLQYVAMLPNLTILDLSNNAFSGDVPVEFGFLPSLVQLKLGSNRFTGSIPVEFGGLSNLQVLDLSNNAFTGSIPTQLGSLSALFVLDVSGNLLDGAVPSSLTSLTSLATLRINGNRLTNLPNLSGLLVSTFSAQNNRFEFDDLQPNTPRLTAYSPQAAIAGGGSFVVSPGSPVNFSITTPGASNAYQWYRNGVLIAGATSSSFSIASIAIGQSGNYLVKVTNPSVPGLTLTSTTFSVTVLGEPVIRIDDFNPKSAVVGASVTLVGSGFSTVLSNNVVRFGSTKAPVMSATPTQLVVQVPPGSIYLPITVTVNGSTAQTRLPFLASFSGSGSLSAASFAPAVLLPSEYNFHPIQAAIGDIDDDGKPDIVVANYIGRKLSIYRNVSTLGSPSFQPKVDFNVPTSMEALSITLFDVDGDGRLDMVIPGTGVVSIYRNISSPGSINTGSFENPVSFQASSANTLTTHISFGDIDADGKPDMAVSLLYFGQPIVSILRNVSSPGSLNSGSFMPYVGFTNFGGKFSSISDFDADGKNDVIVVGDNQAPSNISILRNIGSVGDINASTLAAGVDFATTGSFQRGAGVADFDHDGKLDIANVDAGNFAPLTDASLLVFRNTSSPGTIDASSVAPRVAFTIPGRRVPGYLMGLGDLNGDAKVDIAVTQRDGPQGNTIAVFKNTSTPGTIDASSFAPQFYIPTGTDPTCVVAGDLDGDGKPDLIVTNKVANTISIYTSVQPFSAPPTITAFSPSSGPIGTFVTLTGTNFDPTPANNLVEFNGTTAAVTSATTTTLVVTVLTGTTDGPITVTVAGNTATSAGDFTVVSPGTIVISPQPISTQVCDGATTSFVIGASGTTNIIYQWQKFDGSAYANISDGGGFSGTSTTTLSINTTGSFGTGDYRCKVSGDFAPDVFSNVATLTVNPIPGPPTFASNPAPVCTGFQSSLSVSGTVNGNYRWYDGTTLITGQANGTYITPALFSHRTFGVSIHDGTCESPIQTVVASVQTCSPPVVAAQVNAPFIPGVIRIDLTPLLSDPENNLDLDSITIISGLPSGATATIDGTDLVIDYGGMPFPGIETIVLRVCDLTELCSEETLTINLSSEIAIFNAISPNADGKNDVIFIENIDLLPETQQNKLTLFDRWGSVVFEAVNYNNTTNTFRGLGKNGEELPSGTYFYSLEFSSGAPKRTGFISLRK